MCLGWFYMSKRKKPKMPPLSVLDKFIYYFLLIIIIVISYTLCLIPKWILCFTAFPNTNVLAAAAGSASLIILIPTLTVFCISFCFWIMGFEEKQPIFGKKGIVYGKQTRDIYPLFGQQHKPKSINNLSKNKKMYKRFVFVSLTVILVLSFVIGAFGIYSRYELTDNSIAKYNCLNHVSYEYPLNTVTQIEVDAYYHSQYRAGGYYTFSYTVFFNNGKDVQFDYSEFRNLESVRKIDNILHAIPKKIIGIQNLDALRREYDFNDQDWAIIKKLFST